MPFSDESQSEVGVIGLDLTGRNVVLRLLEQHFKVAAYDGSGHAIQALREHAEGPRLRVAASVSALMSGLRQPRTILLFSGADAPMNFLVEQLLPDLQIGDLVMDAGASHFQETAKHKRRLAERCVQFIGLGLGGGEKGARHGSIIMAGGGREARRQARPLLEAMAGAVRGEPSLSFFESAAAAHFAKMVHAGIDSALLQLLSETFDLLQRTLLLTDEELHDAAGAWHIGLLHGYLMEIAGQVLDPADRSAPPLLLREKLASAKTNDVGRWLAQSSWELEVAMPTIEAAVEFQRVAETARRQALLAARFRHPVGRRGDERESVLDELQGALQAAMIITYAQGLALLQAASTQLGFRFNLHEIARSWRGCAHLRANLLDDITTALERTPDLPGLLSDDDVSERVMSCQENLRHAIWRAHEVDAVVPALLASLDYLDCNRAAWLPVNLIQVPRRGPEMAPVSYSYS